MSCHSLSHLITSYSLGWKQNHFHLATLKLVPRLLISYHILSRLVTPSHILSELFRRLKTKPFLYGNFKISSQAPIFFQILSRLVIPYHTFSHVILLGWKQNQFHLQTLKLFLRSLISYHILSCLVTSSGLITSYPLAWKQNNFHLETLELVARLLISDHILLHLTSHYKTLSHLIPQVGNKIIFNWQL